MDRAYPLDLEGYLSGTEDPPKTETPPPPAQSETKQAAQVAVKGLTQDQLIDLVFALLQDARKDTDKLEFPQEIGKFKTREDVAALAKADPASMRWIAVLEATRRKGEPLDMVNRRVKEFADKMFPPPPVEEKKTEIKPSPSPLLIIGGALLLLWLLKKRD